MSRKLQKKSIQSNTVLEGGNLLLRTITIADAKDMFIMFSEQETMRLAGTLETFVFEQVEVYCARVSVAPDRFDFAIILKDSDTFIGEAILNRINLQTRTAHYRIAILQDYVNKHYGTEATELILDYAFDTLGLHRIEIEIYNFNERALYVYDRIGFVTEGKLRDVHYQDGEFHDAIIMSMLEDEWRKLRRKETSQTDISPTE